MAWWLLLHFKIQPLQSLNAASVHLDSGWLSDSLHETLMSHMIQEEFPCACGEGLWGRVIFDSPISSPLCCHPRFVRLKADWRRDSSTRLSTEREDRHTNCEPSHCMVRATLKKQSTIHLITHQHIQLKFQWSYSSSQSYSLQCL